MSKKTKRAYRYRFYPTDEQKKILAQTFGCCRFVYNWGLATRKTAYFEGGQSLYYHDLAAMLPALKQEYPWLAEVSSVSLQQALRHLDRAFVNFFEGRAEYPVWKSKHNDQSATYASNGFQWDGTSLTLAKMDAPLAIRFHRPLPEGAKPTTITVTRDRANRYFVSIRLTEEIKPLPISPKLVGLDLGLKSLVVTSDGQDIANPKYFARDKKKLAKVQRSLARKKKGSKNRAKARLKVARLHAKIADRRRDYQHKLSTRIVNSLPAPQAGSQVVCVESLAVKNMVKNHSLAKAGSRCRLGGVGSPTGLQMQLVRANARQD